MNREDVEQLRVKIASILEKAGVIHSAVFGSFARGEAGEDSDIDILIEFRGEKTLLDFIALKLELEAALSKKVDLITYKSLSPFLRDRILKEQVQLL